MKQLEQKLKEGAERNAHWQSLTAAEQLADLDARLGKGVGATRQRAILAKKLAK